MKTFFRLLVLVPAAVILLAFAFANRQVVSVSFDPFQGTARGYKIDTPLFLALFASVMLGIVIGGVMTWLSQGKHRRAARRQRAEADRLRAQIAAMELDPRQVEPPVRRVPNSYAA